MDKKTKKDMIWSYYQALLSAKKASDWAIVDKPSTFIGEELDTCRFMDDCQEAVKRKFGHLVKSTTIERYLREFGRKAS